MYIYTYKHSVVTNIGFSIHSQMPVIFLTFAIYQRKHCHSCEYSNLCHH